MPNRIPTSLISILLLTGLAGLAGAANPPERNAQAFLFVLEFGLGSPFTQAQEDVIVGELLAGWKGRTAAELQKFDSYPQIVALLMRMGQSDLDAMRKTVEETVRQWLTNSPAGDPAVKAVRAQLDRQGKVVAAGEPPLTEMALAAYSEMVAFAELLREDPEAAVEDVAKEDVDSVRQDVLRAWKSFGAEDRKSLATSPALWITMRKVLRYGEDEEKDRVRGQLLKLAPGNAGGGGAGSEATKRMMDTMIMSQIKQQTFNSYMWSRGYQGWTPMGKI
jgi:hypothetical protein